MGCCHSTPISHIDPFIQPRQFDPAYAHLPDSRVGKAYRDAQQFNQGVVPGGQDGPQGMGGGGQGIGGFGVAGFGSQHGTNMGGVANNHFSSPAAASAGHASSGPNPWELSSGEWAIANETSASKRAGHCGSAMQNARGGPMAYSARGAFSMSGLGRGGASAYGPMVYSSRGSFQQGSGGRGGGYAPSMAATVASQAGPYLQPGEMLYGIQPSGQTTRGGAHLRGHSSRKSGHRPSKSSHRNSRQMQRGRDFQ